MPTKCPLLEGKNCGLCDRNVPVGCHICEHGRPRDPHAQTGHGGDDLKQMDWIFKMR